MRGRKDSLRHTYYSTTAVAFCYLTAEGRATRLRQAHLFNSTIYALKYKIVSTRYHPLHNVKLAKLTGTYGHLS